MLDGNGFLSTPSGWRATNYDLRDLAAVAFLSTPSGWRATTTAGTLSLRVDISIHALRVEGDTHPADVVVQKVISIHALRVEGDDIRHSIPSKSMTISIHALRVEGDARQP